MADAYEVQFLRDVDHGGAPDQAAEVAAALAAFVGGATATVDVAIYDFRLADAGLVSTVVGAFTDAVARGVTVRIGYDAGKPADATALTFARLQADPAPAGTAEWVTAHFAGTGVQTKALHASPYLMHSKYIVRDAETAATAAVWTGSTNFTDDAWTLQENNILRIPSQILARGYAADFAQLWAAGAIKGTGKGDTAGARATLGWDFSPGDGPAIDAALTQRIATAKSDIRIGAMVLTSHAMLDALVAAIGRGVTVHGVYDAGQMDPIVRQWKRSTTSAQVVADWEGVASHLSAKHSTPYTPTGPHDFMHLKVLVADDTLSTGSYNFSANAERNAENQVHTTHKSLLTAYRGFLDTVAAAYA
jgi:phosphatidylserine/phosphatidylglycerophosphate/cardiolipin synthase-like enzyme